MYLRISTSSVTQQLPYSPVFRKVCRCVMKCIAALNWCVYSLWKDVSVGLIGEHKHKQQHHPLSLKMDLAERHRLFMYVDVKYI